MGPEAVVGVEATVEAEVEPSAASGPNVAAEAEEGESMGHSS